MKLLLRDDVDGVGQKGDIVDVAAGYGRNFLLPRGLAIAATRGSEAQAEGMRRSREQSDTQARTAAEEVATSLVGKPVTIPHKAGAEGKLFGSVTSADISEAVLEQYGIELDRKEITIDDAIKSLGDHLVMVKLHSAVAFPISLSIVEA